MNIFRTLFNFSKKEIDQAFDHANLKKRGPGLTLLQAPLPSDEAPSYGKLLVIVPRKAGKAHKRNRLRRQVKAIFYENKLYQKPITSILLVREKAMSLTQEELKKFLISCFRES